MTTTKAATMTSKTSNRMAGLHAVLRCHAADSASGRSLNIPQSPCEGTCAEVEIQSQSSALFGFAYS